MPISTANKAPDVSRPTVSSSSSTYRSSMMDIHETVKFSDGAASYSKDALPGALASMPPFSVESHVHTIDRILSRPYLLLDVIINNLSTTLGSVSINDIFNQPNVLAKISAFGYIRATMNLKLVINGSPFVSGRAILFSSPYESTLDADRQYLSTSNASVTSYPHVECDIGSGETPTLSVPFCAITPWTKPDPADPNNNWSECYLQMLNPLRGVTSTETANCQVYGWLSDLELSIPVAEGYSESEDKTDSVISSSLNAVSKATAHLEAIPVIGSVASDISWIAGLSSRIASACGLSRPLSDLSVRPIANVPAMGFTNAENVDSSVVLGLRPSNCVTCQPDVNFSHIDPLQLTHFMGRDVIVKTFQFSSSDATNTILVNEQLSIDAFDKSLVRFAGHLFEFWRGGLVFRISSVKNPFYSGRLSVEYSASGSVPSTFSTDYPSIIWDIRSSGKEIYFKIPFVSLTRMKTKVQSIGRFIVRVINPLKVSDTLSPVIDFNISMCSDNDMSFACPTTSDLVYTQGIEDDVPAPSDPNSMRTLALSLLDMPLSTYKNETIIMGEACVSMLDLIKRFTYFATSSIAGPGFTIDPHYMGTLSSKVPMFMLSRVFRFHRGSMRYKIRQSSLPKSGSTVCTTPVFLHVQLETNFGSALTPPGTTAAVPLIASDLMHWQRMDLNPVLEFTIPYFCTTDRVINNTTTKFPEENYMQARLWSEWDSVNFPIPPTYDIYCAAGDDFSFSLPLGLPTMS